MKQALFSPTSLDTFGIDDNMEPQVFSLAPPATSEVNGNLKQALFSSTSLTTPGHQSILNPFNFSGGIVQFVVPANGNYDIAAFGAAGASGAGFSGGEGGEAEGVFALTAGEVLEIAVGGAGTNGTLPAGAGGGGGGSFVILNNSGVKSVLVVGGGGGGGSGFNNYGGAGQAGGTTTGGTGLGGGGTHGYYGGGGGGGYKGDGNTGSVHHAVYKSDGTGGKDYAHGLLGGAGGAQGFSKGAGGAGGFGGGGGGGGGNYYFGRHTTTFGYGGGGGGYSGGASGGSYAPHSAFGGTSFLAAGATNPTFTVGVQAGAGYVSVTELPCFAAGTRILTEGGLVAVERLRAGMLVPTHHGPAREIVWIGHRTVDCLAHREPPRVNPVRVRAGAFGPGVPEQDVRLSPDHAVFVDGVLIPVRCLIDGETICQEPVSSITYFHVELAEHDVIFAEGLPVESFLDTGNRANFANGGTIARLTPDFSANTTAWQWETRACAPLIVTGAKLEIARARLRDIADQRRTPSRANRVAA